MGGQGGQLPIQILADQLTLSQSEGEDCASIVLLVHPSLGSFLRPWIVIGKHILKKSRVLTRVIN